MIALHLKHCSASLSKLNTNKKKKRYTKTKDQKQCENFYVMTYIFADFNEIPAKSEQKKRNFLSKYAFRLMDACQIKIGFNIRVFITIILVQNFIFLCFVCR